MKWPWKSRLVATVLCLACVLVVCVSDQPRAANISVTLVSPTNGATVSGIIDLMAEVSEDVVRVEFYRDETLIAVVNRMPRITDATLELLP